jgi:hypothetical protein
MESNYRIETLPKAAGLRQHSAYAIPHECISPISVM